MSKYDIFRLCLNFFELAAFVTGIIYWKKLGPTKWKWFVGFLFVIATAEILSEYRYIVLHLANQWLYTFFVIPFEFLFYYWLFHWQLRQTGYRRWPAIFTVLYVLFYAFDMAYLRHLQFAFSSFSYMTGCVMLLILVIIYFSTLVKSESILEFKKNMMFWVCAGILIFFLGSFPFYGLWNTLMKKYPDVFNIYWMVQMGFDCLMYLFFSIGIIWGKPK
jgi:hypothetical protein